MILPKVTIEKTIEILREKYQFSSTGDALLILKLIEHIEQLHLGGVVRPEVESAKAGELLGNAVGKGVRVGSYYCIRKDHKDSVCLKQCDWCKSVSGKH